jgi:hypothetical protein
LNMADLNKFVKVKPSYPCPMGSKALKGKHQPHPSGFLQGFQAPSLGRALTLWQSVALTRFFGEFLWLDY